MTELAAEFRSEQDSLGECNQNRLLAAAECFAHAAIRRAQGIRAWMSRSGDSIQSMRRNLFVVEQTQYLSLYILYIYIERDIYKRSAPKQGRAGASNFHLLGVGAEKSSLYRLGLLGFDAYLIIMKRGRFDKGAFKPFCWIVGPQPRPIE